MKTLVVVLAAALLWAPLAQAAAVGQITHLSGTLSAKRADGSTKLLSVKSEVQEGDTLGTESETYARIKFVDGETVSIKVGNASGTFVYSQLGMADGRNAKPTVQWELLIAFARGYGALTWSSAEASRKNQKRREMLAANLKQFFRIDGDPIEYLGETKGWRTLFTIEPDL